MSVGAWDTTWAAERAAEAVRYLAEHYPECAGADALDAPTYAAHEAAMVGDRSGYLDALREFMRVGREIALERRKGAA